MTATVAPHETVPSAVLSSSTLPVLDSLRAVAAVAVVATHASFWGGAYAQPVFGTALARLDIGVAIFFVLSGFLLSRHWLERHAHGLSAPSASRYLWKRALRIVPVYVVAVIGALALLPENRGASPSLWAKTLLMVNTYVDTHLPHGLTQMWSLAVEVAFYLVLPGIMWLALSRRRHGVPSRARLEIVVVGLVALNVVWILYLSEWLDWGGSMIGLWLPSYLTWFSVGMLIAAAHVQTRRGEGDVVVASSRLASTLRQMGTSPGVCWTAGLALFAVSATPVAGPASLTAPTLGEAVTKNLLYAVTAGLIILPAVFADRSGLFIRVMSTPFLRHLGHISYGIFCAHLVILELVTKWRDMRLFEGRTLELFVLTLVLSVVVAEVFYRLLERPSLRLRNLRFPGARSTDSTSPSAAATRS